MHMLSNAITTRLYIYDRISHNSDAHQQKVEKRIDDIPSLQKLWIIYIHLPGKDCAFFAYHKENNYLSLSSVRHCLIEARKP